MNVYEWIVADSDDYQEKEQNLEYWLNPRNHRQLREASGCSQLDIDVLINDLKEAELLINGEI